MSREVRSRGRSVRSRGRSTVRADRQMTAPREALTSDRLEDFKPAGAVQRRCRSGSMAVEPQPAGRRLGIGTHREPSGLAARRVFPDATRVLPDARRVRPAARRAVRAARQATPAVGAASPGPALSGTGTALRATSGRTGRPDPPDLLRLTRAGPRRSAGAASPATVWGSWITTSQPPPRSGQRCGRERNQRVVVRRAAAERPGRQGERLVVEMLAVRRLVVKGRAVGGLVPRPRARRRLAAHPLPVLGRRSSRLQGRLHQHKSWKVRQAKRTVAAMTGR